MQHAFKNKMDLSLCFKTFFWTQMKHAFKKIGSSIVIPIGS